jgi:murein DD-endopeptidase MepM/ murein hydrolase activator NlpD
MQPRRPVSVGQHVSAGQVIGYEGNTGNSTGAHLHWMVELNGTWKNPRLFL